MINPIFQKPLRKPKKGEKVYLLSDNDINEILRLRSVKTELDPGMGGVSPKTIENLLKDSELVSVDFALTSACNFRCPYCYRPDEEWGKMLLDFNTISRVIEQSAELGVRFFILTGGEPLIYSSKINGKKYSYFDVVDKINEIYDKNGIKAKILTFSDVAVIDKKIARKLAENNISLCLKRDTLNNDTQDKLVGVKGGGRKIEQGYQNLFEAGYGRNPDLAVSVNHVLTKNSEIDTLKGAIDLHMWIRSNGMEHSIVPIHYCGEAIDEKQEEGINPLEVKALYDIMAEIDRIKFNDPWIVYSAFPKNNTCNRPGSGIHIRATGEVTSCSESPKIEPFVFGNVNSGNLIDMIRSDKFKKFKEEFEQREGEYICNPNVCDLNANYLCRGGCATRSAYSKIDSKTGLIVQNIDMLGYSKGREDPLCPGWIVLAQKQGVLKEGIYEKVVDRLLNNSELEKNLASQIKDKITNNFNKLIGTL